jgi:plastocyanin
MKRREFVEKLGVGSAVLVSGGVLAGGPSAPVRAEQDDEKEHDHDHRPLSGNRANATVSFGAWQSDPPHDRFTVPTDRTRNQHQLIPHEARIKAGGSVNFVIGGFHNVNVYGPGTRPEDINTSMTVPGSAPPLIDDPNNRVYRGLDPRTQSQDRVEVVHFANPGRYLVICGVRPHFQEGMFGFVRVDDADDDN